MGQGQGCTCSALKEEEAHDSNCITLDSEEALEARKDFSPEPVLKGIQASGSLDALFRLDLQELQRLPIECRDRNGAQPPMTFQSGSVYEGQWQGCSRHGFGVQRWSDGSLYEGQWDTDVATGRGRFTFSNGDVYIGEWSDNTFHGLGIYYAGDGRTYSGSWCRENRHGYGVEESTNRKQVTKYAGNFHDNKKHGYGVYAWPDGGQYMGAMSQDSIEGHGRHSSDGNVFEGEWRASVKHGFGSCRGPLRSYSGRYEENKPVGWGCYSGVGSDGKVIKSFRLAS